jgi:predicted nucleotidyltransferase
MLIQEEIISKVIQLALNNGDIEVVWLYGSRATDSYSEHSDFDIAIAFKNFQLSATDRFLRPNELALEWSSMLSLPENKVSIVDINLCPIYLSYNVISDGKVIYDSGTSRGYREESRIFSQYEYQCIESRRDEK